ncbi:MAG TPA: ABC transporter ATP-binding protein/permease [Cellvibrio sp.]|nr:ABC transporter ATP-binding protein/permease [Cellvibrio sp.]
MSEPHSPSKSNTAETPATKTNFKQTVRYLWPYISDYKRHAITATVALFFAKAAILLSPWALKHIIDSVDANLNPTLVFPVVFVLCYGVLRFGSVFFEQLCITLFYRVSEYARRNVTLRVFRHIHQLELAFHLDRATGGISRDIERGASGVSAFLILLVIDIVPTILEIFLVAAIFIFAFSPWYGVVTIVAVVVYLLFIFFTSEWRNRFLRQANEANSATNSRAVDSLLNYETVKYFDNDELEAITFNKSLKDCESANLKNRVAYQVVHSGQSFIIAASLTAMMWIAVSDVLANRITVGDLAMINAYMLQLFIPLSILGSIYRHAQQSLADMEKMLGLLQLNATIVDAADSTPLRFAGGNIEWEQVNFSYHKDRPILQGLTMHIAAGTKVAIVGASGAGKSTIARLLFRFYDIDSGSIKIDGQDIRDVTLSSLRRSIAVVPQDTVLFNASIRENIAYGNPQATDEQIDKAIDMAHLRYFINSLAERDRTMVGERGLKVSGGEKQRIAIARVLLKSASILIFDEATSALDSHSENSILEAMREIAQGHTSIVIAHRLSTVVDADKIIVLDKGQVVEQGVHTDLLNAGGHYARLWVRQQQEQLRSEAVALS